MAYPTTGTLVQSFNATHRIIKMQTDGLTHADSLLQLPFRGNCLNWVLGHIVVGRNSVLKLLEASAVCGELETARYVAGSEPITNDEQALPFERLLKDLDESQRRITTVLEQSSSEALGKLVKTKRGEEPVGKLVAGLHWHETYHYGTVGAFTAIGWEKRCDCLVSR